MKPPDAIRCAPRVLGLLDAGDPSPALVDVCERLGMDLLPYVECMPFGPSPRVLIGPINHWRLALGLSADFSGFIELGASTSGIGNALWEDCIDAVARGGLGVSLSSTAAYAHDLPCPFITAIGRRFPTAACIPAMELALYEALANGIIHGNLGIDSALRGSAAGLREYRAALAHALADPGKASRRVVVTCQPVGPMLRLTVRDQGQGWNLADHLAKSAAAEAKSGRGLDLIHQVATTVSAEDGGRKLIMDFSS